jgi:hypothetical protein
MCVNIWYNQDCDRLLIKELKISPLYIVEALSCLSGSTEGERLEYSCTVPEEMKYSSREAKSTKGNRSEHRN